MTIREEADFVVVGSGAAGATVAWVLAKAGHEVVVLEEGPPARPAGGDALEALSTLYRDGGAQAAIGPDVLPILQGCCVGGTTVVNGGIQVPFPRDVWDEWVAIDPRWARRLPWDELERARRQLDELLGVVPTPEPLWGGNGSAFKRGMGDAATPTRRNAPDCRGSGRCLQGCPNGAKRSADLALLRPAQSRGMRLHAGCRVERLARGREGRASEVVGRMTARNTRFRAHARKAVILAASAIGSPFLLERSGFGRAEPTFQCHPGAAMAGLFPEPLGDIGATQAMESLAWRGEGLKFETLGMPRAVKCARVPGVGKALASRLEQLERVALWGVSVRARARGRVLAGPFGPIVRYGLTPPDRRSMLEGLALLASKMLDAGATEVWPAIHGGPEAVRTRAEARALADLPGRPGAVPLVATHLFGGVRVGDRFEARDIPGLVVADSSLFPSNLGVNPMSAIMAVATLVAEHWR